MGLYLILSPSQIKKKQPIYIGKLIYLQFDYFFITKIYIYNIK